MAAAQGGPATGAGQWQQMEQVSSATPCSQRRGRRSCAALTLALLVALMGLYTPVPVRGTQVQVAFELPASESKDSIPKSLTSEPQSPLKTGDEGSRLHGRFLHITDLHPDPNYKYGSAVISGCHKNKPKKSKKKGKWRAGWWGTGKSGCDSPPRLVSATLDWLSHNWLRSLHRSSPKSQGLDFIIWTGDSARHDIDNSVPRSAKEIFELNRWALGEIEERFPGVPIVPNLGNNDIFPHNIMFPGPNAVTKTFASIWSSYIPEYQIHTFVQGAYYSTEVIPGELAVISLNTLYFYNSNKAVDGCVRTKKGRDKDPGTAQLEWLLVQLQQYRSRSMQVHLVGHVSPLASNYFPRCLRTYQDLALRFQDTIVGQHFGHSNYDAFFVQEDRKLARRSRRHGGRAVPLSSVDLPATLRDNYASLPGRKRTDEDAYHITYVAPSVVPTTWPSVRIWTYNTTRGARYIPEDSGADTRWEGWDIDAVADLVEEIDDSDSEGKSWGEKSENDDEVEGEDVEEEEMSDSEEASTENDEATAQRKKHNRKKKHKKKKGPHPPRHASPLSPSRTNTYLTPLGYSQWILDVDAANAEHDAKYHGSATFGSAKTNPERIRYQLEYATYPPDVLWCEFTNDTVESTSQYSHIPVPKHLLVSELRRHGMLDDNARHRRAMPTSVEGNADHDDPTSFAFDSTKLPKSLRRLSDYAAPTMTIPDVLQLARRLAVDEKLWKSFTARIWSSSNEGSNRG